MFIYFCKIRIANIYHKLPVVNTLKRNRLHKMFTYTYIHSYIHSYSYTTYTHYVDKHINLHVKHKMMKTKQTQCCSLALESTH